jgi:head-tail adaptor
MTERFAGVRGAVIQALKSEFPRLKAVRPHGGAINLKEIERFQLRSPEARVAWVGTSVSRDQIQRATGESTFAVYVICKDRPRKPAADQAMQWADKITVMLDGNKFGLDYVHSARVHSVVNPYDTDQDIKGVAYIEIRFECPMVLEVEGLGIGDDAEYTDEQREITIVQRSLGAPALGSFEPTVTRTPIHTATATVKTLGGLSEINQVALTTVSATHEFTIPYTNLQIDKSCDVELGGTVLNIKEVENQNEQNRYLILRCAAKGSKNKAAN